MKIERHICLQYYLVMYYKTGYTLDYIFYVLGSQDSVPVNNYVLDQSTRQGYAKAYCKGIAPGQFTCRRYKVFRDQNYVRELALCINGPRTR